jgi:multisubunit Na+/H+ antiporter MnhB subunit
MIGRRSVILTEADRWLFPVVLLVSVYVTFRGHNAPGGGFIGGLIAGAAFIIRYLAGTPLTDRWHRALHPTTYIGAGLVIAVVTALVPLAYGDELLKSAIWKWDLPVIGEVKLVSSSFFDIGVYLLVVGVVLLSLISLGADPLQDDEVQGGS